MLFKIGNFGDLQTSSSYIAADQALNNNSNIQRVVGDSSGGSVALELQTNHPELKSRSYSAPLFVLASRTNAGAERCPNFGDPISM